MPVVSENMVNYLGNVATLFTIFQFISGVTVCLAIRKGKTTGDRSSITFISGALMCYVWYRYGIAVKDSNILFVNLLGCVIHVAYSILFTYYCPSLKMKPIKIQCLVSFLIIIFLHGVKTIVESEARITHYTGLLGSVLSIAFAASPLISLRHVFQTKSTEVLPFYIIIFVFVVSSLWGIYGLCKGDPFLIFTNGTNAVISMFQLSLFAVYPSKNGYSLKKEGLSKESII
uniref:Sugar transporter SWEET n=1 Tax=Lepeophtheirus salmonis TaxID=72036 RepID=D3PIC6_LEPSM|nr:RAG1-activating protein 1 homolog [Lepeophtheirus salmonis]